MRMIFKVMENTRANNSIEEEDQMEQEIAPHVLNDDPPQDQHQVSPHVQNKPPMGNAFLDELRYSMQLLAQALTAQSNL